MLLETSTLISLSTWLGSKIADKGFDSVYQSLFKDDNSLNEKFYRAVESTSKLLKNKHPEVLGGSIEYFFKRPDVFNELIKLLFYDSKIEEEVLTEIFDATTLPLNFIADFISQLKNILLLDKDFNGILVNKEIFILVQGLENNISKISKTSTLTISEIVQIKNILIEKLGKEFSYNNFIDLYYENALQTLSQINFLGLGVDSAIKRNSKNLQDIFIKPYFEILTKKFKTHRKENTDDLYFDHEPELVNYSDVFKNSNNIVILGNPGSGKSVLLKSLICDVININTNRLNKPFPIRIELRKYLAYKRNNSGNILKYLIDLLETEYAISNLTQVILEKIFKDHEAYVFFDGLDEIFKIGDKIEIKNDIEIFHNLFKNIKSITTSRIIGYDEAKLADDFFCELLIRSFNDEQIKEYIEKWYEKEEENIDVRNKEISGFVSKMHEIDNELVSNPLLLSLIVILYRNILKLPESKLEIYQSCTKTLVDKWDASKDLIIDLQTDIYRIKEKILADLAFWQYKQLSGEIVNITYDKAKQTVSNSIKEKLKIDDDSDSYDLAETFMIYSEKRSIYFDNNFTHKTFLEYYTAYWIYSNIEKKHKIDERNKIISKFINNSFWHIVLELLLNMIDKDQADSEIMDDLIDIQINHNGALPFLISTISSFKNVDSIKISEIVNLSMNILIKDIKKQHSNANRDTLEMQIFEALKNQYQLDGSLKKDILLFFKKNENSSNTHIINQYILYLELEIFGPRHNSDNPLIAIENNNLYKKSKSLNPYLFFIDKYFQSKDLDYFNEVKVFIKNFGVSELFKTHFSVYENMHFGSFFSYYLQRQILVENLPNMGNNINLLIKSGVKFQDITSFVKVSYLYLHNKDLIEAIISKIENEKDFLLRKILLFILFRGLNSFENPRINQIMKKSKKGSLLTAIFKLKDYDDRIEYIDNLE